MMNSTTPAVGQSPPTIGVRPCVLARSATLTATCQLDCAWCLAMSVQTGNSHGGEVASSHLDVLALQDHAHRLSADAELRAQLAHRGACFP